MGARVVGARAAAVAVMWLLASACGGDRRPSAPAARAPDASPEAAAEAALARELAGGRPPRSTAARLGPLGGAPRLALPARAGADADPDAARVAEVVARAPDGGPRALEILADAATPYRALAAAGAAAADAGVERVDLVVVGPGGAGTIPIAAPRVVVPAKRPGLLPGVEGPPTEVDVFLGREHLSVLLSGANPVQEPLLRATFRTDEERRAAFAELAQVAARTRARLEDGPPRRGAGVVAADDVPLADVVAAIDAVRLASDGAELYPVIVLGRLQR